MRAVEAEFVRSIARCCDLLEQALPQPALRPCRWHGAAMNSLPHAEERSNSVSRSMATGTFLAAILRDGRFAATSG
jgi:hypothetical protein